MGRSTATMPKPNNRTRSTARAADKEDNVSNVMTIHRRFPRLGSAFQTKVASNIEDSYQPSRQTPILLSKEYTDFAQYEAMEDIMTYTDAPETTPRTASDAEKPLAQPTTTTTEDPSSIEVESRLLGKGYGTRGGIRVSFGNGNENDYAVRASRPFLLGPVDRDDDVYYDTEKVQEMDQAWLDKLMDWHQLTLDAKQSTGGRRSRFKRPREAPLYPEFGGERVALQPTKRSHLEADQNILYNPCSSDSGDSVELVPIAQRKWSLNVDLSGGRTWSGLRKRRREGELDSWSKMPASTLPMLGDFRSEPPEKPVPLLSASSRAVPNTWKAVLAAAEAYEKNMACIPLDMLLDFFDHVRRLPPPSQVLDETTRIAQTVNECLGRLWKACTEARELRAKWMDLWYSNGVEIDAVRKALKVVTPLVPDEYDELVRQLEVVASWQERLDKTLATASEDDPECKRNDLVLLEALAHEARATHGFRCKGFVALEAKLQKTYEMQEKLRTIHDVSGTVKTISSMVRDIQKLKIRFPEANELLLYSRNLDTWVERADIAIRSRISMQEVEDLILRGKEYRLDLSEYLDKLQSRVQAANSWIESLQSLVALDGERLEWMAKIREKIEAGMNNQLHELACEGSRLPVEVDFVQMIHMELDARLWSAKAEKWLTQESAFQIPDPSKQGKIEEVRDHLTKAQALKSSLSEDDRLLWKLCFESELNAVVQDADKWLEQRYGSYFEGDSRKTTSRRSISIHELRRLDDDGNRIPINLGSAKAKVNRFLVQAETWYGMHHKLLMDAGLEPGLGSSGSSSDEITLDQLKSAMDDANNGIAFDLEEVDKLSSLVEKVESWCEQVAMVTGAGKRRMRGKKIAYTVEGLQSLVDQASDFPIDTSEAIELLEDLIASVHDWRKQVTVRLNNVAKGVDDLRQSIVSCYGSSDCFCRATHLKSEENTQLRAQNDEESPDTEMEDKQPDPIELHLSSVETTVKDLAKEVSTSHVTTPEIEVVSDLENLLRWATRSIKYLSCSAEIFDKRFYGAFDRFMSEGKDLLDRFTAGFKFVEDIRELNKSCCSVLNDQICRMKVLLVERDEFSSWCEQAEKIILNEDKRCTIEKLQEMYTKSSKFPAESDLVKSIRELNERAYKWIATAKKTIESEERLTLHDLKTQVDYGEKLGIQCTELRDLRNGLRAARSWSMRVKKCKPEQCTSKMSEVNALVDEYESLMVEMPDEIARLNTAIKHYCICRGNHHGLMIQCEDCGDSFHGSCLGLTKARADKMDKFVCVRCSVKKVHQSASSTIAGIVRKWTDIKELNKARQVEVQKHQRKNRKEFKDLEKHRQVADEVAQSIAQIDVRKCELLAAGEGREAGAVEAPVNYQAVANPVEATQSTLDSRTTDSTTEGTDTVISPEGDQPKAEGQSEVTTIASLDSQRVELVKKMEKTTKAIGVCQTRLKSLEAAAAERRNREELENAQASKLKEWCVLVGNAVAPKTREEADITRPGKDGQVSAEMQMVMKAAERLCLSSYRDVSSVENAFKCLSWSARAMEVLRRQPTSDDVRTLVSRGQEIKLPDDKALKTLRNMSQRADAWNLRFRRALTPVPGNSDPFDMNELHELAKAADRIPLILPYEHRLETVIEDEGCRYCACGGPSDGRFMVGCDKCDRWYHGTCVGISGAEGEDLEHWFCPECRGSPVDPKPLIEKFHDTFECEVDDSEDDDVASKAPDPAALWPPFGLKDSKTALEALGKEIVLLQSEESEPSADTKSATAILPSCEAVLVPSSTVESKVSIGTSVETAPDRDQSCPMEVVHSSTTEGKVSIDTSVEAATDRDQSCHMEVVPSSSCENSEAQGPGGTGPVPHVLVQGECSPPKGPSSNEPVDLETGEGRGDTDLPQKQEGTSSPSVAAALADPQASQTHENCDISCVPPESSSGTGNGSKENGNRSGFEIEGCSLTPMSDKEAAPSCPLIVASDSPLRVNPDAQGEVAPVAS